MIEESKVEKALEAGLGKIQSSPDLLDRINREADNLALRGSHRRPGIWSRLRLGPKLEVVAACILLVGLVGIAAYRNLHATQAPAGGDQGGGTQRTTSGTPTRRVYSGEANDGIMRVRVVLEQQAGGDWNVVSTIQNLSSSAQLELNYECDNLMRLNASLIKRDCDPRPSIILGPGETKNEELTLPGEHQGTPSSGWLAYLIRSEGKEDPLRTLRVSIREGLRECCAEPQWTATDVAAKLKGAGIDAKLTGESSVKLFGAKRVETMVAEGENVVVYEFDNAPDAQAALKIMQDPLSHTVSWVGTPQFFQMGNLVIQIGFSNEPVAEKLKVALLSRLDLQRQGPGPDVGTGEITQRPSVADVTSAYIPGQPKMPNWRLTEEGLKKVIAAVQAAQWVAGDESVTSPPSNGPAQPLTLVLELTNGHSMSIRLAGDCQSTARADGSQVTTCSTSESELLVAYQGRMERWLAPGLAQWLTEGWQADVQR